MRSIVRLFARPAAYPITVACVALATGGVLLSKSPRAPRAATAIPSPGAAAELRTAPREPLPTVEAAPKAVTITGVPGVTAKLSLSQGRLQAGSVRQVFAQIDLAAASSEAARSPVAVAVALDVSGSMSGEKIESARRSLLALIDRLGDDDELSVITFSSEATTLQPLARVGSVRRQLRTAVAKIEAGGGTNISDALRIASDSLGAARTGHVRRVVLLSDGQDSSGAKREEVSRAVRSRAEEGTTLSALGIGNDFDEAFMTQMADAGRGNYAVLQTGRELEGFLTRELDQARQTVIEGAVAELTLPPTWKAVRAFGVDQEGRAGTVRAPIGALFAGEERRIVIELGADPEAVGAVHTVTGRLAFRAKPATGTRFVGLGAIAVATVAAERDATASIDGDIHAHAVSVVAAANQREAVAAWRLGNVAEAQGIAAQNILMLDQQPKGVRNNAALMEQANEYARDRETFAQLAAESESGRGYGLRANLGNWTRSKR